MIINSKKTIEKFSQIVTVKTANVRKHRVIISRTIILIAALCAFIIGLLVALLVFNSRHAAKDINLEVTFVSPREAVIFWKSEKPTIGYVRYGQSRYSLDKIAYQTSSTKSEIHAVVLDDVPLEGLYMSIHNESDSWFLWPKVIPVVFDPTTIE